MMHSFDPDPYPLIVGRDAELQTLSSIINAAETGRGAFVLISGEAGIGKTTVVQEMIRLATDQKMLVLSGACYEQSQDKPACLWGDLFETFLLEVGQPPTPKGIATRSLETTAGHHDELLAQLRAFLGSLATSGPLLLALEDLHWADQLSLDVLLSIGRGFRQHNIVVVATLRQDELDYANPLYQTLPSLIRELHPYRLDLKPLDLQAVRQLITRQYVLADNDLDRLARFLIRNGEGNPFFTTELLRALEDRRVIHLVGDQWIVEDLSTAPAPPVIQQVVTTRIDRHPGIDLRHIQMAAVIGNRIPLKLWQEVAGLSDRVLIDTIESAVQAGILTDNDDGRTVSFRHTLVHQALYDGILSARRLMWHREIASYLRTEPVPDVDAIAYHLSQAGDAEAVDWLIQAGDRAMRGFAGNSASRYYLQALQVMEDVGTETARPAWVHLRLAQSFREIDTAAGLKHLEEAEKIAARFNDQPLFVASTFSRAALFFEMGADGIPELMAGADLLKALDVDGQARLAEYLSPFGIEQSEINTYFLRETAGLLAHYGRYAEALEQAQPLIEEDRLDARPGDAELYTALAVAQAALGKPEQARRFFGLARRREAHHAVAVLHAHPLRLELRDVELVYYPDHLERRQRLAAAVVAADREPESVPIGAALHLIVEGQWSEAKRIADIALEFPGATRQWALYPRALLAYCLGAGKLARDLIRAALPQGAAASPSSVYVDTHIPLLRLAANLALDEANIDQAQLWINAYERWLRWGGRVPGQAEALLLRARLNQIQQADQQALEAADQAVQLASDPRRPLALSAAHREAAGILTAAGQISQAGDHIREALYLAEACAAPYERALALLVRADAHIQTQEPDAAVRDLDMAEEELIPLEASPALAIAGKLRSKLTSHLPGDLTSREVSVLGLIARGMTNAEAAEELYISPSTINHHLRSIYAKLGVHNRAAAVRTASEQGLI